MCTKLGKAENIRQGDARVEDIAEDEDIFVLEGLDFFLDGESVEEGLGWVLVSAIACVDDMGIEVLAEEMRYACVLMPYDDHIDLHMEDVLQGIKEALTLAEGTGACGKVNDFGTEAFGGKLERQPCSGRIFKKNIRHRDVA